MNATEKELEKNKLEIVESEASTLSEEEKDLLELERTARDYFVSKEVAKEEAERNKMRLQKTIDLYEYLDVPRLIFPTDDNKFIVIERKITQKEVLDMEAFLVEANKGIGPDDVLLDKEELKTPWDFAKLAEKGRITAKMIAQCTYLDTQTKVTVKKVARKPKDLDKK